MLASDSLTRNYSNYKTLNKADVTKLHYLKGLFEKEIQDKTDERGPAKTLSEVVKFLIKCVDLIPNSTIRNAIQKYAGALVKLIDTIEDYTWYGISMRLEKLGVPPKVANLLADVITFLLV